MGKIRVNRSGHIGCLVTRAVFCSASYKLEIVAINDPFIDFNYMVYMVYMFSMTLPTPSSMAWSRLRMGSLPLMEAHHHLLGARSH
jgi:glyceraldehyde-3-phosphate dehydrogenase/erythrose-4-phosphate dehydrogenase